MDYAAWLQKQDWLDPAVAANLRAAIADYEDERRFYGENDDFG
jgi:hypothetical protein